MEMQTQSDPRGPSGGSPEIGGACPRWVSLQRYGHSWNSGTDTPDARTRAISKNSRGRRIQVSFSLAPPPARSAFKFDWVGVAPEGPAGSGKYELSSHVVAAHNDCVLFEVTVVERHGEYACDVHETDYFLYKAGDARSPSLSLLPHCFIPNFCHRDEEERRRRNPDDIKPRAMFHDCTGLLRRGEDDLLVAELELPCRYDKKEPPDTAELCMLRPGSCKWELRRVPVIVPSGELDNVMGRWETDAVVPIGDRFLCWVDYLQGLLVGDMDEASPKLRYVALPQPPTEGTADYELHDGRPCMKRSRALADAGGGAVRFVSIEPRCCCGGPGISRCVQGRAAFYVTTWTLSLTTVANEPSTATWVKDGVMDCEEIWALSGYDDEGLPREPVEFPFVSADDPDMVCFSVCNDYRYYHDLEKEQRAWIVELDLRRKVLLSVVPCTNGSQQGHHVPLKLQCQQGVRSYRGYRRITASKMLRPGYVQLAFIIIFVCCFPILFSLLRH